MVGLRQRLPHCQWITARQNHSPFAVESFVLCISPLASQLQISARITFLFLPSFILFKSKPFVSLFFCTFLLFPWLPLSPLCTLSISPSVSLSVSLTLFLSFSFCFHLCLPSSCFIPHPPHSGFYLFSLSSVFHLSLPFKPAIPSCRFLVCTYGKKRREGGKVSSVAPIYLVCIFNHVKFFSIPIWFCQGCHCSPWSFACIPDRMVNSHMRWQGR